jgi:DNA-binding transcriptional LysR family regulator
MNVTLRQLRAFLAVARTHSFTLAAESLYISQSALPGLVKELEQTWACA